MQLSTYIYQLIWSGFLISHFVSYTSREKILSATLPHLFIMQISNFIRKQIIILLQILFTVNTILEDTLIMLRKIFFPKNIQLFRERLSYKRGKAYAIMSKVIMGNGGFYGCLSKPQGVSAWWKETAQTRLRFFSFLVAEPPWTSKKQSQTLTTHNANRHCRVRFYTFVGQPLSKQL